MKAEKRERVNGMMDEALKEAREHEKELKSLLEERGYEVRFATKYEDIHEKWDLAILGKDGKKYPKPIKIDAKGIRRFKGVKTAKVHWVEYRNVNGKPGSLYSDVDLIAFDTPIMWIIVQKDRVKKEVDKLVEGQITRSWQELYVPYHREERPNERIVPVKTKFLYQMADKNKIIYK